MLDEVELLQCFCLQRIRSTMCLIELQWVYKANQLLIICRQLILSRIPKDVESYSLYVEDNVVKRYNHMDELSVSHIPVSHAQSLPGKSEKRRLCRDKICCEFSMRYLSHDTEKDKLQYFYKLTAFSGREKYIDEKSKELYCAVVACTTDSSATCGRRFQPSDNLVPSTKFSQIEIKMIVELESMHNDYLIMPTNVDFSILPLRSDKFTFDRSAVYTQNK